MIRPSFEPTFSICSLRDSMYKLLLCSLLLSSAAAQTQIQVGASPAGRAAFEGRCSGCHGADGNGGELGPPIIRRLTTKDDAQLAALIREGLPARGMPPNPMANPQMTELVGFLRTLRRTGGVRPVRAKVDVGGGKALDGLVLNQSLADMQLRTEDNRIHLLRPTENGAYREVTSGTPWSTYNGDPGGNRFTTLSQIDKETVRKLARKWTFTFPNSSGLEVTPVVVDGVMYVTAANECYALDAGSGRQIWHFQRPRTKGFDRECRWRNQSWSSCFGRSDLHDDGQRSRSFAGARHRGSGLGNRNGGLASEL